ncbi:hypothetical protein P3T76_007180 [Phytophthora citrophthora]|uniref:Uncharacterized protein n=1 Tax=Phytophthora citrophthora TaxID=4793 RepID=A0AAD9GMU7_9STRA|nr:hypothetical protein P3T76_007180 [Phytophthora citrophthora]
MNAEEVDRLKEPPSIPFANNYDLGQYYYVWKCYDEYYTLVKNMLDDKKRFITVTGTPGIGKSIFYAYFFQRFREEMKKLGRNDTWIIAAAYNGGEILRALAFKDHNDKGVRLRKEDTIDDFLEEADQEKKKRLRDGVQTVVFTSPNDSWMRRVKNDNCTLYMPLWTLTELQKAAEELALQRRDEDKAYITSDVIKKRFYTFGGAARECFLLTEKLVNEKRNYLLTRIGYLANLEDVRTLLRRNETAEVCHRLLQFEAEHGDLIKTDLASPFVAQELERRIFEMVDGKREELLKCLQVIPKGVTLGGWMFEMEVHETLGRGCKLQLRPLPSNSKVSKRGEHTQALTFQDLTIEMGETDELALKNLSAQNATLGPYHKPESEQFESIDGFYIPKMEPGKGSDETQRMLIDWNANPKNRLTLFQTTIAKNHPVNASGIINVLDKLGLVEAVKAHPERVALVFIVKKAEIAANYQRQKIRPERHDNLISVPHIGPVTVGKLRR